MEDKKKGSSFEKLKEGISVHEIESFTKKYTAETFIILAIVIATISSIFDFFTGPKWSLTLTALGTIASLAFPDAMLKVEKFYFDFLSRQEKTAQIIVGIVRVIIAVFVPFIIFAEVGLLAGLSFQHFTHRMHKQQTKEDYKGFRHDDEEHL